MEWHSEIHQISPYNYINSSSFKYNFHCFLVWYTVHICVIWTRQLPVFVCDWFAVSLGLLYILYFSFCVYVFPFAFLCDKHNLWLFSSLFFLRVSDHFANPRNLYVEPRHVHTSGKIQLIDWLSWLLFQRSPTMYRLRDWAAGKDKFFPQIQMHAPLYNYKEITMPYLSNLTSGVKWHGNFFSKKCYTIKLRDQHHFQTAQRNPAKNSDKP